MYGIQSYNLPGDRHREMEEILLRVCTGTIINFVKKLCSFTNLSCRLLCMCNNQRQAKKTLLSVMIILNLRIALKNGTTFNMPKSYHFWQTLESSE